MRRFLAASLVCLLPTLSFAVDVGDVLVVTSEDDVELHVDANGKSDTVTTFSRGDQVDVLEVDGDWVRVKFRFDEGWMEIGQSIDRTEAVQYFSEAIEANPTAVDYHARADLLAGDNDEAAAMEDVEAGLLLDPDHAGLYVIRGALLSNRNEFDAAIEALNRAIALDPENYDAHFMRSNAYTYKQPRDSETLEELHALALADVSRAIELEPRWSVAIVQRARLYHGIGEIDQALIDYSQAIEVNPNNDEAFLGRASLWLITDSIDSAIADYREALRIDPTNESAYVILSTVFRETGEYQGAIDLLSSAIELMPESNVVFAARGRTWFEVRRYGEATRRLRRSPEAGAGGCAHAH